MDNNNEDDSESIANHLYTGRYPLYPLVRQADPSAERLIELISAIYHNHNHDERSHRLATELDAHVRLRVKDEMITVLTRLTRLGWVLAAVGILLAVVMGTLTLFAFDAAVEEMPEIANEAFPD